MHQVLAGIKQAAAAMEEKKHGKKEDKKDSKDGKNAKKDKDGKDIPEKEPVMVPEEFGIGKGLARFYESKQYWDVAFLVGEKKQLFHAHRMVLAARSPVFEAMFYSKFAEAKDTKAIDIPDVEPEAFQQLLSSIYTDVPVPDVTSKNVMSALFVAKKYAVEPLRNVCVGFMSETVEIENACFVFDNAPQLLDEEVFALKFIEDNAADVIKTQGWLEMNRNSMRRVIASDHLRVKEPELFGAVMKWCAAECKRSKLDYSKAEDKRTVLKDIIPNIRFPLFPIDQLAVVSQSQLLPADAMIPLFTYCATKIAPAAGKMPFKMDPRTPRKPLSVFAWSQQLKSYSITLSDEGKTASSVGASWYTVGGDKEFLPKTGVYEWEVVLTQYDTTNSYNVCVGVIPTTQKDFTFANPAGYSPQPGWTLVTGIGQICNVSQPTPYGNNARCGSGDRVGVSLDTDKGELTFYKNGQSLGVAFRNVNVAVRPCLSLTANQVTKLLFENRLAAPAPKKKKEPADDDGDDEDDEKAAKASSSSSSSSSAAKAALDAKLDAMKKLRKKKSKKPLEDD